METQHLTNQDIARIHDILVEEFSNDRPIFPAGIKNQAMLESAVSRQLTSLGGILKYADPLSSAASLAFGLCCNHPFHNGNKRTALVAMLAHLGRNKLAVCRTSDAELEKLILKIAEHSPESMLDSNEARQLSGDPGPDREIAAVTYWLTGRTRVVKRGERQITYRELERILKRFGYQFDAYNGNSREIVRYETIKKGLFWGKTVTVRKHIDAIPFPGLGIPVGTALLKRVRTKCRLREEDGCDSSAFYGDEDLISGFINRYRTILRRLANK